MGRLYLRMSFFCRSLTHHWLFECIVYLLMMLSALLVSLEASRLVHACLHTHKLGTPRIVRGTSLLVIPVSSEAAGFLLAPTPASEQLLAALGEHVEWYPGVRAIHDSVFDDLAELRDLRKQVHWRDRLLPPSVATDESDPLQRRGFDFVELFAGVGGFRLGLEPLGGRCVFSSEINAAAKETYALNFGDGDLFGDVVEFYASDLPPFDLLTGGFPCQPFSTRGVPAWSSMRPGSPQPSRLLRATRSSLWAREESPRRH